MIEQPSAVEWFSETNRASFQVLYHFKKYSGTFFLGTSAPAVAGRVAGVDSSMRGSGPDGTGWAPALVDDSDEAEAATALGTPTELLTTRPEEAFKDVCEVLEVFVGAYKRLRQMTIACWSLRK